MFFCVGVSRLSVFRQPRGNVYGLWCLSQPSFFLFFHPAAVTLIDGDSFSPGHPAGFHLDTAIIKGQYIERLRRIAGEERRDRRRPEDPRRLSSQVPGAEWASRRSTAFHQPRSEDRWLGVDTSRGRDNKPTRCLRVRARRPERANKEPDGD